ncbi:MAG: NAD(P)-dependent oxidoreductase [Proteobacteria bacterium]|nr:NAD(P)-dependent oxidoreductase [Pseudomonadota bacterium]MBU1389509.1 NAD(P)-dependent oxidoreductase [Pseudomonadota bacterium]MBU1541329.1 NAD(P)-dependent oxidoreductase [Pseudomonadota bacterium]MBU2429808.1 NAD(P)-dependent oxidoreductase [Pseudomonadota bacterium]MBU2480566.1 NAD(P)-dependent oxidoreductase [Pseudomonadota bacterium]
MKIAVTGGTGFIGWHLVNSLVEKGHTVRVLTRRGKRDDIFSGKFDLFYGDLLDENLQWEDFFQGIDICYHCAGVLQEADKIIETNVKATQRLLEAASGRIKHWVQLSSIGVYGKYMDGMVTEKNKVNPSNLYEKSKADADDLVIKKSQEGDFTYSILRPSNVYGSDMVNQSLYKMISMIDKNLFFYIGRKQAIVNYIHVDNVVDGLCLCGGKKEAKNQIFNISDHEKLETIVNIIANTLTKKAPSIVLPENMIRLFARLGSNWKKWPLTFNRVDALTGSTVYSNDFIEEKLNYTHKVSINLGFEQLVKSWLNLNREQY